MDYLWLFQANSNKLEKQLKETQKELNRKTDALAELAAIYTLKKKLASNHGIMDEEE